MTDQATTEHVPDPVVAALRKAVEAAWMEYRDATEASQRFHEAMRDADRVAKGAETRARSCEAFLRRMQAGELDTEGMVQEMTQPAAEGRGETCPHHVLQQHRDGKPPWCSTCGLTASGQKASDLQLRRPTTGPIPALTDMQTRAPSPADLPYVVQTPQSRGER